MSFALSQLLEISFWEVELFLAGGFVLALGALHLWRTFMSELRSRKCVFCGEAVPPDEYAHHLEICGLKMIARRGP